MTEINAVNALSVLAPANTVAAAAADPKTMRVEFDAMILEMLIKASGMLNALDSEESGGSMMGGEMLAYPLARQLAEQVDIGFGSMILRMSDTKTVSGG